MTTWSFEFVLSGFDRPTEEALDALFEAGCDDASLLERGTTPVLQFDRDAESIEDALSSALRDVEQAQVGATVLRVEPDDLVNASDISRRTGKSREMVRRWVEGERVAGGFPPPIALLEKRVLWSWFEVSNWLLRRNTVDAHVVFEARWLAAFNVFLETQRVSSLEHEVARFASALGKNAMIERLRALRNEADVNQT